MKDIDEITHDVIDTAIRIHRELGPGLLESVYETILAGKLIASGETLKEGVRRLVNNYIPSASSAPLREPKTGE